MQLIVIVVINILKEKEREFTEIPMSFGGGEIEKIWEWRRSMKEMENFIPFPLFLLLDLPLQREISRCSGKPASPAGKTFGRILSQLTRFFASQVKLP